MSQFVRLLGLLVAFAPPLESPDRVVNAINDVPAWEQLGQQPYEMTWVQRKENPDTLEDFEDLEGWTLELYDGADGELRRSREQQMWGQYVAKFSYSGSSEGGRVVARPPSAIALDEPFDCIELWGYGNRWRWSNDPETPPADVSILLLDGDGLEHKVSLAEIQWKQWWLIHRRIPAALLLEIRKPVRFSGIEISRIRHLGRRYFFCDSLAIFREELDPLSFEAQPRRNLKAYRGQIPGTNTGPGILTFPTREETILPTNLAEDFTVSTRQVGSNQFEFRYAGSDATVLYRYRPRNGGLGEIDVSVDGAKAFQPLKGGGVNFEDTPKDRVSEGVLVSAKLRGEAVEARFRHGDRFVDYRLQLLQKSLLLDVWCDGGKAKELRFGRVSGVVDPKLITVPYITYGATNPRVLMSENGHQTIFSSVWVDWYRSSASAPYFWEDPEVSEDSAQINGGMFYIPKTDGKRNDLYDRVFVTVSPSYLEVLPTVANPPSLRREEGSKVLWTVAFPRTFRSDHLRCRKIRSYGLDKIMQHSHEVTWRDGGESYTMKLRAAPQKGGDEGLKWYVKAQNNMGWLQGVYSNYCDFAPVNTNWNPNYVQRMPDGEWRRAWPRTYALKPARAVEMDEFYARRIKEKYGVKMSYTDVHTDHPPPWEYCDFDTRVPGAGTFAATFYAYGQLLVNDQRVYGPTQSESTFQWLFAGLQSGGYGWVYTDVNLLTYPLDVTFMLNKIHPLECDYGMGYTSYYLSRLDKNWKESAKRRDYLDLFLATTIGYGNMGWLVTDWGLESEFGIEAMTRSYYMMQQLQQQYAFVRPRVIEYADREGNMYPAGQAHRNGVISDSRLHVVYRNGTHVYVNRGKEGRWNLTDWKGDRVELPVSGWLAYNRQNDFYELSGNISGRRIDYVMSKEFEFLDGRSEWTALGNLGVTGSAALRKLGNGNLEIIDLYGNERIAFRSPESGELVAFEPDGTRIGPAPLRTLRSGWIVFDSIQGARSYRFQRTAGVADGKGN